MANSLTDVLFSEYRRRVLGLLLLRPEASYHVREIARMTDTPAGTLHKELSKLAATGILTREQKGNQVQYRANRSCPIYEELASIMRKTSGLADILAQALAPLGPKIDLAFVFGSMARAEETTYSDVDILVVGTVGFAELVKQLYPVQATVGRELNPKVLTSEELQDGLAHKDPFLLDILAKPKIYLIGSDNDLGKLTGDQSRHS
ncbi:DNA polymerase III subunit beta [Pandoraea terrae]|uniref:DNA polymerase III subunit beta n=1 Tax=Pandoraea terrae TaxID=1537710 RepID=A0A5E4XLD8_9BURK|nr:nucleotidyltransferase domain-containing protein [Pandoraea terrae]VVE37040.1 DNA polymerase III subunit beta [Pandoraea terrae]